MALDINDVISGDWKDVPVAQRSEMATLLDQFEKDTGYQVDVPLAMVHSMATAGVNDMRHFSIYVWDHTPLTDMQRMSMPWMGVGLTQDQYDREIRTFAAEYQRLTGQQLNPFAQISNGFITDPVFQSAWDAMRTGQSATDWGLAMSKDPNAQKLNPGLSQGLDYFQTEGKESNLAGIFKELTGAGAPQDLLDRSLKLDPTAFRAQVVTDPQMLNTYGWLKYGKNYEQFQAFKNDQRQFIGHDLNDTEALAQLQYTHELHHVLGAYQTAQLRPEQQTQQAQQLGAPGTSQSEVR